jgi:PAS domain S-box-containing protein
MKFVRWSTSLINRLIDVPTADPDDARRRKLLNIILVSMAGIAVLTMIVGALSLALSPENASGIAFVFPASIAALIGALVFYFINRYRSGIAASILFLLFLSMILALADSPSELANGRSLFLFAIPIIVASVLLGPVASFAFYILVSIELIVLSLISGEPINVVAIVSFLFLSIIAWLSARSLEQALKDLRKINANLDQEVADRTQALTASLGRERVLAGRNQAILDSIADGVIVFDSGGKAIVANPSISRLTEIPADQILGSGIESLFASDKVSPKSRTSVLSLLNAPADRSLNVRIEWGNKVLSTSAAQVLDADGGRLGTVTVFRDFTREAEVERMKNAFVAMVSHELRTPLNAISGYAEMLQEGVYGEASEQQHGIFERIITNTRRLLYIVNDLLDQAQIEAGKLTIRMRDCRPMELVESVQDFMGKIAAERGLALIGEIDPALPAVISGDATRLQQIIVNLVTNAIKFTDQGFVQVRLSRLGVDRWVIQVKDTGHGIPEEAQKGIFDAFQQVDARSTREHGGVGLGLSIVKSLATLMDGEVKMESKVGQGSTFTVTLPLVSAEMEVTR